MVFLPDLPVICLFHGLLEPTWKRRVLNLIIAALIFRVYFLAPGAEAENSFLALSDTLRCCRFSFVDFCGTVQAGKAKTN